MFFQMVTLTPSFSFTLVLGSFPIKHPAQLNNRISFPCGGFVCASLACSRLADKKRRTARLFPPPLLSALPTTTTTNTPLGGSVGFFPPHFTAAPPPPPPLQNPSGGVESSPILSPSARNAYLLGSRMPMPLPPMPPSRSNPPYRKARDTTLPCHQISRPYLPTSGKLTPNQN